MTELEVKLAAALSDLVDDLKLRASLTDEPLLLDVSHSRFVKAEEALNLFVEQTKQEDSSNRSRNK